MFKKILLSLILVLSGCTSPNNTINQDNGKLNIITTTFAQYDFVREIAKDNVNIKLLLPSGTDIHSYEPTATDIISVNNADMFIYTGSQAEPWADTILDSIDSKTLNIIDLSKNISLSKDIHDDDDIHDDIHDDDDIHDIDPHIWTSLKNAQIMVNDISKALINTDAENTEMYAKNSKEYIQSLKILDEKFENMPKKRKTIILAGHNAMQYFLNDYGIKAISAYDSMDENTEPSVKRLTQIIDIIKTEKIPVIFYGESKEPKIANEISKTTNTQTLLLNAVHNVPKTELESTTYYSIMQQNYINLEKGLND